MLADWMCIDVAMPIFEATLRNVELRAMQVLDGALEGERR